MGTIDTSSSPLAEASNIPRRPKQEESISKENQSPESNDKPSSLNETKKDVILRIYEEYMEQIVSGEKTYEFRKYDIGRDVQRIWFFTNAPVESIQYVCEIEPARTRNPGDWPLDEDGVGNREFNERDEEWVGYDFAYRIRSVYKLKKALTLEDLREHGVKELKRSVDMPVGILEGVDWRGGERVTW